MLKLEWNSLRAGDHVFVHGGGEAELALVHGVVFLVDTTGNGTNGVGIRIGTGDSWRVVWPLYLAVHTDPLRGAEPCRSCEAITTQELRRSA